MNNFERGKHLFRKILNPMIPLDKNTATVEAPKDYCEADSSRCVVCGWEGDYPISGCPVCNRSFCE